MRKLTLADIDFPAVYEERREEFRRRIIALKRVRRVALGDRMTLVFENRETMKFQIQEMCRIEQITDQDGILAEVEVYNGLIPGESELSATLLIEVPEQEQIKPVLDSFLGLDGDDCLRFEFDGERVPATFEEGHSKEDRISAVHYVRFAFSPAARAAFAACGAADLVVDHANHAYRTTLSAEALASLRADLASPDA